MYEVVKTGSHRGIQMAVILVREDHHNGYVGIDKNHPLYEIQYDQIDSTGDTFLECHGGLTYSGKDYWSLKPKDLWWFGFDTAHMGDKGLKEFGLSNGTFKTIAYVYTECLRLADQLAMPEYSKRKIRNLILRECDE